MHLIGACGLLFLCPRILELFVWAILVVCNLSVLTIIASRLRRFLSSDEWFSLVFLSLLYVLHVVKLMHLYSGPEVVHYFSLCFPAHRGQISSLFHSVYRWMKRLCLKHLLTDT